MTDYYGPPPIAPPKGLTGMLEGHQYDPNQILDTANWPPSMVVLNVYDVSDGDLIQRVNTVTTANNNILVGGVFHAGVEVYGKEWCYGVTEYGRSGVAHVTPRTHPQHTYKCSVPYSPTKLSVEEVEDMMIRVSQEWPGHEYDLLHHNCISFCNALLHELILGRVPGWVDRLMKTAAAIDDTSRKVAEDTHQTIELVRSFTSDLEQKARSFTGDDAANQAADALEVVKRESVKAIDVARTESAKASAKLAELAQAQAKDISEKAPDLFNAFGSSFLEWGEGLRKTANDGLNNPSDISKKTQELTDDLGGKVQALGSSLWQWGQDLQKGMANPSQSPNAWPSSASSAQAQAAPGSEMSEERKTKGLLDEDDDDLLSGATNYGTEGMVRSVEEKIMRQSLLDDDDEEEVDNIVLQASAMRSQASNNVTRLEEVEAPLEWLSSTSTTPLPPVVDLLD